MKVAFAGFDHDHIFGLYEMIKADENYEITGIWEEYPAVAERIKKSGIELAHNSYSEMLEYSKEYPDPELLCQSLMRKALNRGAKDNVTVLAVMK